MSYLNNCPHPSEASLAVLRPTDARVHDHDRLSLHLPLIRPPSSSSNFPTPNQERLPAKEKEMSASYLIRVHTKRRTPTLAGVGVLLLVRTRTPPYGHNRRPGN